MQWLEVMNALVTVAPVPAGGEGGALLEEEEWEYLAEGKVHVVLKYCGRRPRFVGHVLRLLKVYPPHAANLTMAAN